MDKLKIALEWIKIADSKLTSASRIGTLVKKIIEQNIT